MRRQGNLKTFGQQIFGDAVTHQARGTNKTDVFHAFLSCDESKNTHAKTPPSGARRGQHARAHGGVQVITFGGAGTSDGGHVGDSWADDSWFSPALLRVPWPKVKSATH